MSPAVGSQQRFPSSNWEASRVGLFPRSPFLSQLTHWGPWLQYSVICIYSVFPPAIPHAPPSS